MKSYLNITHLILRAFYLYITFYLFFIFVSSALEETGHGGIDIFAIPLFSAMAIISYAIKIREERFILLVILTLFVIGISSEQGSFMHTNLVGISLMTLFFHAIRPWK